MIGLDQARRAVCRFMEPEPPTCIYRLTGEISPQGWWRFVAKKHSIGHREHFEPTKQDLDRLRLVEEKLTEEQWQAYLEELSGEPPELEDTTAEERLLILTKWLTHASADAKVMALAKVVEETN